MNSDIQNFIAAYRGIIDTYKPKVAAAENIKLKETEECLQKISAAESGCRDIGEFMVKISEQDLINTMTACLSALAMESLKTQQSKGDAGIPSAVSAALGYHKAYEAMTEKEKFPETCSVYKRIFQLEKEAPNAAAFVRMLAEEGLYAKMTSVPLVEEFCPLAANAESLSLPGMAYHHECMLAMAEKATSSLEIEYESNRLLELNRMELMCDELLMGDLFHTLGNAISGYLLSPIEENRQRVENAYRFVAEFFGVDDAELFSLPRVIDMIDKIIIPMLNNNDDGKRFTREIFITEHREVIKRCMKGQPPAIRGTVSIGNIVFWGKKIPLQEIHTAFRKPPRPEELMS